MTIEQEARDLVNEVCIERGEVTYGNLSRTGRFTSGNEALCRALEQRDAERQAHADFRQRVSDAMEIVKTSLERREKGHCTYRSIGIDGKTVTFSDFINPKPVDPLVEVMSEVNHMNDVKAAEQLRAALAKRGLVVREEG